jgi:hypothetical protein
MAGLPCLQVGNAIAVNRDALISQLKSTVQGDRYQWERARRTRVADSLEAIRKHAAARRFQIPIAENLHGRLACKLSSGIELRPGELRIVFATAEELASKLFELSQAMANDWPTFIQLLEDPTRKSIDERQPGASSQRE